MGDIFLQRDFEPPLTEEAFWQIANDGVGCLSLHRVEWRESLLSVDGRRLVCWFRAADAQTARDALLQAGVGEVAPWAGTIHDSPVAGAPTALEANVAVERHFDEPVTLEAIQAIEDAGAACLSMRNVAFARTCFSRDRRRMVCLYRAPDADAVREAQRQAGVPFTYVWRFVRLSGSA
jgi:hypothetical protein